MVTITKIFLFFNTICSKVIELGSLYELEHEVAIILCQLEMFFAPTIFDIMVDLIVYLVREIRFYDPIYLRWMYLIE